MEETAKVRLSKEEVETIKSIVKKYDPAAEILIFGSRTDLTKRGGDIDMLIVSGKIDYRIRRKIRVDLQLALGDRKVDLIITDDPEKNEFTKIAYKYGVKI
ncbi:MAG: nucleotidyltransferase domain-containing protein [Hydrogenobacter thermophilus]|uniref:nucleotidyltransferase domain-containing protein n=1 Tax=Hydrogenobacter thermophilus TaxID=940 RepID=UPI001C752734|nr:nucleotidyltransferase domain-containing protein [Hydrogenobacter thermophilus]QWK19824.1 MAG: nucleotidyltransferase domain-containing protein [Hydrogenobacter thermophilus]